MERREGNGFGASTWHVACAWGGGGGRQGSPCGVPVPARHAGPLRPHFPCSRFRLPLSPQLRPGCPGPADQDPAPVPAARPGAARPGQVQPRVQQQQGRGGRPGDPRPPQCAHRGSAAGLRRPHGHCPAVRRPAGPVHPAAAADAPPPSGCGIGGPRVGRTRVVDSTSGRTGVCVGP